MSTHIPALHGEGIGHDERLEAPSFFSRLVKGMMSAREAQAKRYIRGHLNGLSDLRLKEIGFTDGEIAEIRASKQIAPSYWF